MATDPGTDSGAAGAGATAGVVLEDRAEQLKRIDQQGDRIWTLLSQRESRFAAYLTATNAGGAVAVLSFLGASETVRTMLGARIALVAFVLGVLTCGVMLWLFARAVARGYREFHTAASDFRDNKLTWRELLARSQPKPVDRFANVLAGLSLLCIVAGALAAAGAMWHPLLGPDSVGSKSDSRERAAPGEESAEEPAEAGIEPLEQTMEGDPPSALHNAVRPERGLSVTRQLPATDAPSGGGSGALLAARRRDPNLVLHSLNIGAGSCHFIECPGSSDVIVYDCGQMHASGDDMKPQDVIEYFESVVGEDAPAVILSHADADHVNLIADIMREREPEVVLFGGKKDDYGGEIGDWLESVPNGKLRFDWKPHWHEDGKPVRELQCGDASVYMATVNVGNKTNAQSLVIVLTYGEHKFVLAGDAFGITERSALRNVPELLKNVTFLAASHHGAHTNTSNSDAWMEHLTPQIVLYSSGTAHGHPNAGIASAYREYVDEAPGHRMWAAKAKDTPHRRFKSVSAEYVTKLNGIVKVTSDGASVSIGCSQC